MLRRRRQLRRYCEATHPSDGAVAGRIRSKVLRSKSSARLRQSTLQISFAPAFNACRIWRRRTPFPVAWRDMATHSASGACFTGTIPIDDLIEEVAGIVRTKEHAERSGRRD
jgi:hypothetical protein